MLRLSDEDWARIREHFRKEDNPADRPCRKRIRARAERGQLWGDSEIYAGRILLFRIGNPPYHQSVRH